MTIWNDRLLSMTDWELVNGVAGQYYINMNRMYTASPAGYKKGAPLVYVPAGVQSEQHVQVSPYSTGYASSAGMSLRVTDIGHYLLAGYHANAAIIRADWNGSDYVMTTLASWTGPNSTWACASSAHAIGSTIEQRLRSNADSSDTTLSVTDGTYPTGRLGLGLAYNGWLLGQRWYGFLAFIKDNKPVVFNNFRWEGSGGMYRFCSRLHPYEAFKVQLASYTIGGSGIVKDVVQPNVLDLFDPVANMKVTGAGDAGSASQTGVMARVDSVTQPTCGYFCGVRYNPLFLRTVLCRLDPGGSVTQLAASSGAPTTTAWERNISAIGSSIRGWYTGTNPFNATVTDASYPSGYPAMASYAGGTYLNFRYVQSLEPGREGIQVTMETYPELGSSLFFAPGL